MNAIDLTQTIDEGMPVYPGTEKPLLKNATTIERNGFAEKLITMYSHTGTHMDAPAHMLPGSDTLDNYEISSFTGRGIVIDVRGAPGKISREMIERDLVDGRGTDFILLCTGWGRKWGGESYFRDFPVLDDEAAQYISGLGVKGLGLDCISVDPVDSTHMKNHIALMKKGILIIENLCNLESLRGKDFIFCCFPLKIQEADGSPIRAVGLLTGFHGSLDQA